MPVAAITAITLVLSLIEQGAAAYGKIRADLQQSGEWTGPEADAFDARMSAAFGSDAWKQDSELDNPQPPNDAG